MFFLISTISLTNILLILAILALPLLCVEIYYRKKRSSLRLSKDGLLRAPSPWRLPIIGHLHLLGGYEVPYQAFSALGAKFGNVVNLQLGSVKCVVINGQTNIREALVTKGHQFDSRPDFQRYQQLFSGNKQNSLAFCDWSDSQKAKRDMLKTHTFPRAFTNKYTTLEYIIASHTRAMIAQITHNETTELKPLILTQCANIFLSHFCSKSFKLSDKEFIEMVENFDDIFYEVNQGHAADFLPFLMPLHKKNLQRMNNITHRIRTFVEENVIGNRFETFDVESDPVDYVESLIHHVKARQSPELSWDTALFALEDIIGGHSAVGNFLMKLFGFLVSEPEVQNRIHEEIDEATEQGRFVTIGDRNAMPYTEAVIFEAVRLIASPIVPRVANQDSSIDGYSIEQGSVLFLNNYDLSMSNELWDKPEEFLPERFIKNGRVVKPEHFLPFGGGRRGCLGYKMVQLISFGVLGGLMQNFHLLPVENESYKVPIGSLALKRDTFKFRFVRR